jgi:hypothetical protein
MLPITFVWECVCRDARRYVPRSLPLITVADGMDREMLVMVRDELTGPLHEPYGAYYLGMWSLVLFHFVGPYRLSYPAGDMV